MKESLSIDLSSFIEGTLQRYKAIYNHQTRELLETTKVENGEESLLKCFYGLDLDNSKLDNSKWCFRSLDKNAENSRPSMFPVKLDHTKKCSDLFYLGSSPYDSTIFDSVFKSVVNVLNNKKEPSSGLRKLDAFSSVKESSEVQSSHNPCGLSSYSKSLGVSLFKYNQENQPIGFRKLELNTVGVSFWYKCVNKLGVCHNGKIQCCVPLKILFSEKKVFKYLSNLIIEDVGKDNNIAEGWEILEIYDVFLDNITLDLPEGVHTDIKDSIEKAAKHILGLPKIKSQAGFVKDKEVLSSVGITTGNIIRNEKLIQLLKLFYIVYVFQWATDNNFWERLVMFIRAVGKADERSKKEATFLEEHLKDIIKSLDINLERSFCENMKDSNGCTYEDLFSSYGRNFTQLVEALRSMTVKRKNDKLVPYPWDIGMLNFVLGLIDRYR